MSRAMIVGESWITTATHIKGFDRFSTTTKEEGIGPIRDALSSAGVDVVWMPSHDAGEDFPLDESGLEGVDVVILSDVGANTFLLHPDTWLRGRSTPNRLELIPTLDRSWWLSGDVRRLLLVPGLSRRCLLSPHSR